MELKFSGKFIPIIEKSHNNKQNYLMDFVHLIENQFPIQVKYFH